MPVKHGLVAQGPALVSSEHFVLDSSNQSPRSSSGKRIMAIASHSMIVEASPTVGNLLVPPSILDGSLSSVASEGISLLSSVGGSASVCPTSGDGQGQLGDAGWKLVPMLPSSVGSAQWSMDGIVGGLRSDWGGKPGSGEEEMAEKRESGGKVSGLGWCFQREEEIGRVGRRFLEQAFL